MAEGLSVQRFLYILSCMMLLRDFGKKDVDVITDLGSDLASVRSLTLKPNWNWKLPNTLRLTLLFELSVRRT